jgi:hypothetical protein
MEELLMQTKPSRPRWWVLYLVLPLMIGLFLWETRAPLSLGEHRAAEIGIILFIFSLVWLWLKVNSGALIAEEQEERRQGLRRALEPARPSPARDVLAASKHNGRPHAQKTVIPYRIASWVTHFFHLMF